MVQKIIQVGNSLAVTIPKDFAKKAGFKRGEDVIVETYLNSKTMLIKPISMSKKSSLTPEFYAWLNEATEKYKDAIIDLAHKH